MNIRELTGNGPQLRFFFVAAALLTALTFICWLVWLVIGFYWDRVPNLWWWKRLLQIIIRLVMRHLSVVLKSWCTMGRDLWLKVWRNILRTTPKTPENNGFEGGGGAQV
jgi:hypothetical protein